jgi:hypothetical protein
MSPTQQDIQVTATRLVESDYGPIRDLLNEGLSKFD